MKIIRLTVLAGFLSFALVACQSGDQNATEQPSGEQTQTTSHPKGQASVVDEESAPNILQVAAGSADHTTLVAAVQAAEIEHVLVNAGPLTVFAPTNAAFDALPEGTLETLLKPESKDDLTNILLLHSAPGSYDIESLKKEASKGRKVYTASGDYLDVVVEDDVVYVAGAKVITSIQTSNGIINVVDKVILP